MCLMIYACSDKRLPNIDWNESAPSFNVRELKDAELEYKKIKKVSTKSRINYVGAHTGCGCGFNFGSYEPTGDESMDRDSYEEECKGKESVKSLFQYIYINLDYGEELELYSYWAGREGNQIEKKTSINISTFSLGEEFYFEENQLILIQKL